MKTLAASKFKAQCLALIDNVAQNREPIVITKHGKPLVKVVPIDTTKDLNEKPLKGMATYIGDIVSPIDEEWEVMK
ncbi:MAG: type II toxin-antitoxin system Phd/YefM family antitoxin [bacterium]